MKVKYKEEYEKNKGKSMLEFVETPSYQASKEAQKMQSEVSSLDLLSTVQHIFGVLLFERIWEGGSERLMDLQVPTQEDPGVHSLDLSSFSGSLDHLALSLSCSANVDIRPCELVMSLSAPTFCDCKIDTFR